MFLALGLYSGGPGVGPGLLTPEISLPKFSPPHVGLGPAGFTSAPLLLDGCGFFNSVVIRLPFNLISDDSE